MIKIFVWTALVSVMLAGCAVFEPIFEPTSKETKMMMNDIRQKAAEFEKQGFDKEMAENLAYLRRLFVDKQNLSYVNSILYKKMLNAGSKEK